MSKGTWGRDGLGVLDEQVQTSTYRADEQQVLTYSIGNCIQYPVINHNEKEYEEKNVRIRINESLCCTVEIWRRKWQPTPVFSPGKSHGQRSLLGYSPQGRKELDVAENTHPRQKLIERCKSTILQNNKKREIDFLYNFIMREDTFS